MANIVINDALGRLAEIFGDGANLQIIPCSALVADATLKDGNATPDITAFFAVGGNTEATAGGWSRKDVANASVTVTVDDTGDLVKIIIPDQTWTAVATSNDVVGLIICEDTNVDGTDRVLTKHDFAVTTDGNDVTADFHDTNGFWQSS